MSDDRVRLNLRQARRNLKEVAAKMQRLATELQAKYGADREFRWQRACGWAEPRPDTHPTATPEES